MEYVIVDSEQKLKFIAMIGLPVLVIIFYITASMHFSYTPDDTYIYLQYARNTINGDGISFNAGEPSYGFTSPLWLLLISLGGKMGIDLYIAAKALDIVLASFALVVFFLVAYEMIRDIFVALLATTVFSFNAWFLRWTGSGMESSLAVLLVLLTFWYCLKNDYVLATVFATLLTLVRPEAFLLMGLIIIDLYINSNNKRKAITMGGVLGFLYVMFLLPWFIYAYATFGRFFPNTGEAKAGLNFDPMDILLTLVDSGGTIGLTDGLTAAVFLIAGYLYFFRGNKIFAGAEGYEAERFFVFRNVVISAGWILSLILFYAVIGLNPVSRYFLIIIPFITIISFLALHRVVAQSISKRFVYPLMIAITLLVSAQNQVVYHKIVLPRAEAFERSIMDYCFIPIGKWLKSNTPDGTTIAVPDIGAIGYYSHRKIFDTAGLISPEVIPLIHEGKSPYAIIEQRLYTPWAQPDYILHHAETPFALKANDLEPVLTKMVGSLKVFETRPMYYSLYKILKTENKP